MMASRVLSRFLPGAESDPLDRIRSDGPLERNLEAGRPLDSGDQSPNELDDEELNNLLVEAGDQRFNDNPEDDFRGAAEVGIKGHGRSHDRVEGPGPAQEEDEVPPSLLMENRRGRRHISGQKEPASSSAGTEAGVRWQTTREHNRLHFDDSRQPHPLHATHKSPRTTRIDAKEQALWRWTNVQNVDGFLLEVYQYYTDHGLWSIMLARLIYTLTTVFLFGMYLFLSTCVDFSKIPQSKSTTEILIPQCMKNTSFLKSAMLWLFVFWWTSTIFRYATDTRRLWNLHEFYHHLLGIPDSDLQAIPWERVVEGLMSLRHANPETAETVPHFVQKYAPNQSKQRMDAHDIANRLMRRDNYYIALINKEILDLSLPLPFVGNRQFYSKSLEWCLGFVFENFIFDDRGHVQQACLEAKHRQRMIEALRRRLRFAALISILMAPFNIGAHCVYYFSRYYAEFRNSPSQLGARAFTPLAEWKMREFNELDHDFRRRIKMAYPFADRYLNQFPKDKMNQTLHFVSLVTGTVAAVLGIATLLDPELFLGFEVTPGRTAFFYLSISMGIFAAARNAIPEDSEVHEPVLHLFEVIEYTHYCPQRWRRQLHSNHVKNEFSALYQMKILIFFEEILSLVVAPFILWNNSGEQSKQIIDFFRQCTVHVPGLGELCNYAVFPFRKRKNAEDDDVGKDAEGLREEYFGTKDEKMAMSHYFFMQRLGQYDQQQASRYQRHQNIQLPPSFPPLSPLREAAVKTPSRAPGRAPAPAKASFKSPSPHRSILLDLQHKRHPGGIRRAAPSTHRGRNKDRHDGVQADATEGLEREAVEVAMADLTTSRLIEQDDELSDEWKLEQDDEEQEHSAGHGKTRKEGADGVLGLLVEYSKAHAERKGRKGSRIGT